MLDYTIITNRTKKFTKTVRKLWISERKNCNYLSRTRSQFNCENSLRRIFDLLSSYKQNLMQLFCDTLGRNVNLFERFENQAVHSWSKRGWISALHKSLRTKPFTHHGELDLICTQNILLSHISWFLYYYTQISRPEHLLSTNQSYKPEKSVRSCFSISVTCLCLKTMQVSSA